MDTDTAFVYLRRWGIHFGGLAWSACCRGRAGCNGRGGLNVRCEGGTMGWLATLGRGASL